MKNILLFSLLCSSLFLSGYSADINHFESGQKEEKTYEINIKMVGDDLIHKGVYEQCLQSDGSYNFDKVFANVKKDIESADIAIINQETIFVHDKSKVSSYPTFGTPDDIGHAIVSAGFDVVAHATNHTMDKGISGIEDTISFWKNNYPEIQVLGIHDSAEDSDIRYVTKNNVKVGFVNYTYGLNGLESRRKGKDYIVDMLSDTDIEATLKEASENSDILVAILHAGDEYVYEPTSYQKRQIERFIDNGASIILCAHPHVLQPYEMLTTDKGNTGLVYYSLGNFVSSQSEVPRVIGGMADIRIKKTVIGETEKTEVSSYDLVPLVTHQESGCYITYRLDEYPEELADRHRLVYKGFSISSAKELINKILKENKK